MKASRLVVLPLSLLAFSGMACKGGPRSGQEDPANIQMVRDDDAVMNAARARARAAFATFTAEVAAPEPETHYSVKLAFRDGDAVEHLWVNQLTYQGRLLMGVIDNEPVHVRNVQLGQRVIVSEDDVSDWLIFRDGRYRGGYTIRLFRDRMTPAERRDFDARMGGTPSE